MVRVYDLITIDTIMIEHMIGIGKRNEVAVTKQMGSIIVIMNTDPLHLCIGRLMIIIIMIIDLLSK